MADIGDPLVELAPGLWRWTARPGVRLCPESWLRYLGNAATVAELREALEPLRALPVDMVLVSHGEPMLGDGAAAIDRALAAGA